MDWKKIKSIFQIPKSWFQTIHCRVFKAYTLDFLRIRQDGDLNGLEFSIDMNQFADYVHAVGVGTDGIKTINGKSPDDNGNLVLTVNGQSQDNNGNIHFTVDGLEITQNPLTNVWDFNFGLTPGQLLVADENGHISTTEDTFVKTVNNKHPDANGNVNVSGGGGWTPPEGEGFLYDVNGFVNLVQFGKSAGTVAEGNHTHTHSEISDWNIATYDFLKAIQITSIGATVGLDYDDADHTVCGPNHGHKHTDIVDWDTAMGDFVKAEEVADDGITAGLDWPDPTHWVCPTNHGHLHTDITDWDDATDTFIEVDEVASLGVTAGLTWDDTDHWVCPTNHGHLHTDITDWDEIVDGFVTLGTLQTIIANKIIQDAVFSFETARYKTEISGDGIYINTDEKDIVGISGLGTNFEYDNLKTTIDKNGLSIQKQTQGVDTLINQEGMFIAAKSNTSQDMPNIILTTSKLNPTNSLGFTLNATSSTIYSIQTLGLKSTSRSIISKVNSQNQTISMVQVDDDIWISSNGTITLDNSGEYEPIVLGRHPVVATSDQQSSLEIATVGWVFSHTVTKPEGTGFLFNNASNQLVYIQYGTSANTVAEGNHKHTHSDITDWSTATSEFATQSWVRGWASPIDHSHTHDKITDWDTATSSFLTASKITSVGATVGLDYNDPTHTVCGPNHGHKHTDIVDWDDAIEDLDDKYITIDTTQNNITGAKTIQSNFRFTREGNYIDFNGMGMGGQASGASNAYFHIGTTYTSFRYGAMLCQFLDSGFRITNGSSTNIFNIANNGASGSTITSLGGLELTSNGSIQINQTGSYQPITLSRQPVVAEAQKDNSLEVATVGWVSSNTLTTPELDPGEQLLTTTETEISQIEWTGTVLRCKKRTKVYKRGLLVKSVEDSSWTTIDVAVTYNPS